MIRSDYLDHINEQFEVHSVCALLGPRQVGKMTLAKMYAEKYWAENFQFFDLEDEYDLAKLDNPMLAFSSAPQELIVIYEIQRRPELFPILRVIVDQADNKHKFLILGSASRDLIRQSSETLAGRIGHLELAPFSLAEVKDSSLLWLRGGFPRSYLAPRNQASILWRKNYIKTFLERDIPSLGFDIPAPQMRRFWMMLVHYHGQIFNSSEIGRSLGVSDHTVRKYLDILAGTFMVRVLYPWFENLNKRQVKSPKIYFRDSGILNTLARINNNQELQNDPKLGAFWEGFALEQMICVLNVDSEDCYFWATHADAELDLLVFKDGKRLGFEFKYMDAPKLTKSMHIASEDLKLDHLFIIYPGDQIFSKDEKISVFGLDSIVTGEFEKAMAKFL